MVLVEAKVIDSTHLELLRPIAAAQGGTVSLTLVEPGEDDTDRNDWLAASAGSLGTAYCESEPDYSSGMLREPNPDYRV